MRYAVISDIHANRQALKAVLNDIDNAGVDRIVCLGDIVGYGPSPQAVADMLRERTTHFVLGNHDAVLAGYIGMENFNLTASKVIEWTAGQLDGESVEFFKTIPLMLLGNNIRFAHAEFANPARFSYTDDEKSAIEAFNSCSDSLLLLGHSHVPGIFVIGNSGIPHWLKPVDFGFEEHKRYIVNAGAVGQPRDNDNRASYCIIDEETNDVYFRKVGFDIAGYRRELEKHSLPAVSSFLFIAKDASLPRTVPESAKSAESDDFTPLSRKDTEKIQRQVQNLEQKVTDLKRSRKTLLGLLVLSLAALSAMSVFMFTGIPHTGTNTVAGFTFPALSSALPAVKSGKIPLNTQLLSMPDTTGTVTADSPLEFWNVSLTDPVRQKVKIIYVKDKHKEIPAFSVESDIREPIVISSVRIPVKKGMRFSASASFIAPEWGSGIVVIRMKEVFPDGTEKILISKEPKNIASSKKWIYTTITIPSESPVMRDGELVFEIRGQFTGTVHIRKCTLKRKQ